MRISLVTPCFNAARFIRETLGSVLNQEFDDLEYIVVDGGSTDGTAEIIHRQRQRLTWWVSEAGRRASERPEQRVCAVHG
jgi:glycosyltransferase involved in cell wall biosynthesis